MASNKTSPAVDDWQIKDDMRTLARAEEIKRDPKRLAAAKKSAREELANLKKVADATAAVAGEKC